ncbi:MAG TPA: peptidoglycan-binding protein [Roseiarcus sp.]|jgi:hypothetical protein|nr:peptidoglycan-binding protein [Roseiarcus sp.]
MKRVLLASAACLALSLPAMAANTGNQPNPPLKTPNQQQSQATTQPSQPANQQQSQAATQPSQPANQQQGQAANPPPQTANQQQAQVIAPSKLSKEQIREIQTKLDKAGFKAKRVDGIWGRETKDALMSFQKAKNLPGNGELNQQTLADLGVNMNSQAQATSSVPNQSPNAQAQSQANHSSAQNNMRNRGGSKAKTP